MSAPKPGALILLATGGTGGHMFPAEALAGALLARGYRVGLVTDRRGRGFGDRLPAVEVHRISAGGIAGGGALSRAHGILRVAFGLLQARSLMRRLSPKLVVGFGGYASVPAVLAAQRVGIATLLHEQNAVLGRANRLLAPRAALVACSFAATSALGKAPSRHIGNPVRAAIAALAEQPYGAPTTRLNILVLGGSQGARVFSRLLPGAIALLAPAVRERIAITQQCRPEDLASVRAAYDGLGLAAELATFFDDVARRLGEAHLVICRSGASTVAELAAAGRPAILIPYPHATDDHQTRNAENFCAAGGGWLMPEAGATPECLAERITSLLAHPGALCLAAAASRQAGRRDAAERLAALVSELAPANGDNGPAKEAA
jgi:UDP-N-acetylglucosamine--N-acetylmuramyl-(pentapeptide) pyrophosphoryl-undecaprenol N-acetylglucosamine transferase